MGAGLIAFLAIIVGLLVAASDGRQQVATRTYTAPGGPTSSSTTGPTSSTTAPVSTERNQTGVIPIGGGDLDRAALALFGGGDPERSDDDEVVLVTLEGTELGRGPLAGWYTNSPDRGVDFEEAVGGVVLAEAPAIDDPLPGCGAVHGAGGVRASVCGSEAETDEIRVVAADGSSRVLTGPVADVGHWRFALPSPDGKWVLSQWSGECEVPEAHVVEVQSGGDAEDGIVYEGHDVEVHAVPLDELLSRREPPPGELRFTCGGARYFLFDYGPSDETTPAPPDRSLLERAADRLVSGLYCTRGPTEYSAP